MAVDSVTTSSSTGVDGNAYTSAVSNDTLTNEDFLTLMLAEMQQQDPTDPTDTSSLLDSQMQMSQIQSNQDMVTALEAMQASYSNSAISTAANLVGTSIKTGETDDSGDDKIYKVVQVDNSNGELSVQAQQFIGVIDGLEIADTTTGEGTGEIAKYDADGTIYEDDVATDYRVSLSSDDRFNYNADGSIMILDSDNEVVTDTAITSKYIYGGYSLMYSDEAVEIPVNSITSLS